MNAQTTDYRQSDLAALFLVGLLSLFALPLVFFSKADLITTLLAYLGFVGFLTVLVWPDIHFSYIQVTDDGRLNRVSGIPKKITSHQISEITAFKYISARRTSGREIVVEMGGSSPFYIAIDYYSTDTLDDLAIRLHETKPTIEFSKPFDEIVRHSKDVNSRKAIREKYEKGRAVREFLDWRGWLKVAVYVGIPMTIIMAVSKFIG